MDVEWLETKYSADPCCFVVGEEGSFCGLLKRAATIGPWKGDARWKCRQCEQELRRWERERRVACEDDGEGFDLGSVLKKNGMEAAD